jgi:hypothetical protein
MNVQNVITEITRSHYIRRKDRQYAHHPLFIKFMKSRKGKKKKKQSSKLTHVVTTLNLISVVNYGKCIR